MSREPLGKEEADNHEADAVEFVKKIDKILIEGMKLSQEEYLVVFPNRQALISDMRTLLSDSHWIGTKRERERMITDLKKTIGEF